MREASISFPKQRRNTQAYSRSEREKKKNGMERERERGAGREESEKPNKGRAWTGDRTIKRQNQ